MISKEEFKKTIENMKSCDAYQDGLNKYFRKNNVDGYLYQPDCIEDVVFLLEEMFNDKKHLINIFCFDLEYGKLNKGIGKTEDGEEVSLSTVDELYDLLVK